MVIITRHSSKHLLKMLKCHFSVSPHNNTLRLGHSPHCWWRGRRRQSEAPAHLPLLDAHWSDRSLQGSGTQGLCEPVRRPCPQASTQAPLSVPILPPSHEWDRKRTALPVQSLVTLPCGTVLPLSLQPSPPALSVLPIRTQCTQVSQEKETQTKSPPLSPPSPSACCHPPPLNFQKESAWVSVSPSIPCAPQSTAWCPSLPQAPGDVMTNPMSTSLLPR